MKKFFALAAVIACLSASSVKAQEVLVSTSGTDAFAGSDLNIGVGETGFLYIWVNNNSGFSINSFSVDIFGDSSIASPVSHSVQNDGQWDNTSDGNLGDLVTDAGALDFSFTGGSLGILDGEVSLFSVLEVVGQTEGTTGVDLALGSNGMTLDYGNANPNPSFGGGSITVGNAIPEPATGLAALAVVGLGLIRRRRA